MRQIRLLPTLAILLALGLWAAVASQPIAHAQQNLLVNPGFDGQYSSFVPQTDQQKAACTLGVCTTAQMPDGWFPWWVSQSATDGELINRMPEYKPVCPSQPCPFLDRVKGGTQAAQYFTFHSTHTAGMWQRVTVPANARVKYSVWGQAWSSATDTVPSDYPTTVNMRVGIDPTGGSNPFSGSIVWSGYQNPYDNYVPFEIEAAAQGTAVTVFMWSAPAEPRKHNDIYWDEASLVVVGQGPAPAGGGTGSGAAPAAPAYVPGPTPTPNAEGLILVTVQPGDTMWALAARANLTLDEFLALNPPLTRDSFINVGEQYIIGKVDPPAAEPTPEPKATAAETATENSGDSTGETAAEATPAPTAEPSPEPTAAPVGATVCLRAFDDTNRDGVLNEGEGLKAAVAFTIADGDAVISNYVTDGASEPYCIEGLPAGTYRISRSLAANEMASNAPDWALALTDGANFSLDFGSYVDETAAQAAQTTEEVAEVAMVATTTSETSTAATENTTSAETTSAEIEAAATEAAESASSTSFVTWIIVGIAAVLLVGVILVVLSGRRA